MRWQFWDCETQFAPPKSTALYANNGKGDFRDVPLSPCSLFEPLLFVLGRVGLHESSP